MRQLADQGGGAGAGSLDVRTYHQDGFAVLDPFLSEQELRLLRDETLRICRTFSTAQPLLSDEEVLRQFLCVHFPHKMSGPALQVLRNEAATRALTSVIGPDVKAMQSMLFIKAEGKPGQAWHQDEYFIPTRDRSLTAIWIALDDSTTSNGCLWVLPGSHRDGVIYPEREIDDSRFDCTTEAYHFPFSDQDAVPVEVPAGAAVIFNGYLLHRSLPNSSRRGLRRALVNHYMSAQSLLPWRPPGEGEHVAMVDDRDIVMVAGHDPYAYKGLEDHHRSYLRPEREGGCQR